MEKYVEVKVKTPHMGYINTLIPLDSFEEETGVYLDEDMLTDEIGLDEFTESEIADYIVDKFKNEDTRYTFGLEDDDEVTYVGYKLVDENGEDID